MPLTLEVLGIGRREGPMLPAAAHKLDERQERLGLQQQLPSRLGRACHPGMLCLHVGHHIGPGREGLLFVGLATCTVECTVEDP